MRAWKLLSVLALPLFTASCAQDPKSATAIAVSVQTDYAIGTELSALEYRAVAVGGTLDKPAASFRASASQMDQPYVLLQNEADEVLIAVQGLGPANEVVVQYSARARFEAGKTVLLEVVLAKVCKGKVCNDGQTCHGRDEYGVRAGECGPVSTPSDLTDLTDPMGVRRWDANLPSDGPDGGKDASTDGGDGGPEAGVCTVPPDAGACDPVKNCGCSDGQVCRNAEGKGKCYALKVGTAQENGSCTAVDDCAPKLTCTVGEYCTPVCESSADCRGAPCFRAENARYGLCLAPCTAQTNCPGTSACLDVSGLPGVPSGMYCAKPPCDPVRRQGCPSGQTCQVNPKGQGLWEPACVKPVTQPAKMGGICTDDEDCALGYGCIGRLCKPYCAPGTACSTGGTCTVITSSGIQLTPPIGTCPVVCTTGTECAAGAQCGMDPTTGARSCYVP